MTWDRRKADRFVFVRFQCERCEEWQVQTVRTHATIVTCDAGNCRAAHTIKPEERRKDPHT